MKIIRFRTDDGQTRFGTDYQVAGDQTGSVELLDDDALKPTGQRVPVRELLVPFQPPNIFCVGLNYREHARETGSDIPEHPVIFMKPTSSILAPGAPIPLPKCCTRGPEVDFEAELAVFIGRATRDAPEEEALDAVMGYSVANDVSARKWQRHAGGKQWIRGKGFDGFCPLGPMLVTPDEIEDPQSLAIRTLVNGELMQDSSTADMIFPIARIISYLSQDTTLLPGTVILTGTPWGVGFARKPPRYLSPGDEVVVEIEQVGRLVNPVKAAD